MESIDRLRDSAKNSIESIISGLHFLPAQWNLQDNNYSWNNKLPGYAQCFYNSDCMFLSTWLPEYGNDEHIKEYIERFEILVNPDAPDAIDIKKKYPWATGPRLGNWWVAHYWELSKTLASIGKKVIFKDSASWDEVDAALAGGSPVILQTYFGQGHIILQIGKDIFHDPYGKAPDYKDKNGSAVEYKRDWLKNYVGYKGKKIGETPRIIYAV